jgi:hypothetical protein
LETNVLVVELAAEERRSRVGWGMFLDSLWKLLVGMGVGMYGCSDLFPGVFLVPPVFRVCRSIWFVGFLLLLFIHLEVQVQMGVQCAAPSVLLSIWDFSAGLPELGFPNPIWE